jgi:hypothetical protein
MHPWIHRLTAHIHQERLRPLPAPAQPLLKQRETDRPVEDPSVVGTVRRLVLVIPRGKRQA